MKLSSRGKFGVTHTDASNRPVDQGPFSNPNPPRFNRPATPLDKNLV
jgi:hypothetical protein